MSRYFEAIAKHSFRSGPNGERLFFPGHFWKAYVIPNASVEQKLFKKQLSVTRAQAVYFVLLQPFLFMALPSIIHRVIPILSYFLVMYLSLGLITWAAFRSDIKSLSRVSSSTSAISYLGRIYEQRSTGFLVAGFLLFLTSTLLTACLLRIEPSKEITWIAGIYFALCLVIFGLNLSVRLLSRSKSS